MSDEPTWTERVERETYGHEPVEAVPAYLPRRMAAILDDPQRQEDEEAGRLLEELMEHDGQVWVAVRGGSVDASLYKDGWRRSLGTGPTPVAALRALRDAIGGEE